MIGISVPEGEAAENWSARKKDRGNAILLSLFTGYRLISRLPETLKNIIRTRTVTVVNMTESAAAVP